MYFVIWVTKNVWLNKPLPLSRYAFFRSSLWVQPQTPVQSSGPQPADIFGAGATWLWLAFALKKYTMYLIWKFRRGNCPAPPMLVAGLRLFYEVLQNPGVKVFVSRQWRAAHEGFVGKLITNGVGRQQVLRQARKACRGWLVGFDALVRVKLLPHFTLRQPASALKKCWLTRSPDAHEPVAHQLLCKRAACALWLMRQSARLKLSKRLIFAEHFQHSFEHRKYCAENQVNSKPQMKLKLRVNGVNVSMREHCFNDFFCTPNFVVLRKICFKHIIKTNILHPEKCIFPARTLKPGCVSGFKELTYRLRGEKWCRPNQDVFFFQSMQH